MRMYMYVCTSMCLCLTVACWYAPSKMAAECHTDTVTSGWGRARRVGLADSVSDQPGRASIRVGRQTQAALQLWSSSSSWRQHSMPFSVTSKTNLNCQPVDSEIKLDWVPVGQWPTSSFLPVHPMAGTVTDSICAVPIRRWNGWRICLTCPVPGPSESESACCCLSTTWLCQYRAQPEGFTGKLAWHRDWHHCEIGTSDPVVYIVQLSHRGTSLAVWVCCFSGSLRGISELFICCCWQHAYLGSYMQIQAYTCTYMPYMQIHAKFCTYVFGMYE